MYNYVLLLLFVKTFTNEINNFAVSCVRFFPLVGGFSTNETKKQKEKHIIHKSSIHSIRRTLTHIVVHNTDMTLL